MRYPFLHTNFVDCGSQSRALPGGGASTAIFESCDMFDCSGGHSGFDMARELKEERIRGGPSVVFCTILVMPATYVRSRTLRTIGKVGKSRVEGTKAILDSDWI